jgi:hypothetical protein
MNPSTAEIVAAIEASVAPEVLVLPNNPNVILAAEQAAQHAHKPVWVVPSRSIPAGLAAMVAYDGDRGAEENAAEMEDALAGVATGAVTRASREVEVNGRAIQKGAFLGLTEGEPVAAGVDFEEVAESVVERLLAGSRSVLTVLTGGDAPSFDVVRDRVAARHPDVEIEVRDGGQPHYHLLLSAE